MLLYVDKKRQKRHRIKLITITLSIIFFLCTNIVVFNIQLQKTDQHLTNFPPKKQTNSWYAKSDVITIFTPKESTYPHAIIIPQKTNRENLLILALAFSKMNNTPFNIECTSEIKDSIILQKLAALYNKSTSPLPTHKIIISSQIAPLSDLIKTKNLHPTTLHFQNTKKLQKTTDLQILFDTLFPLPTEPQTQLEKEQHSLKKFALKYQNELQSFFAAKPQKITFTNQNLFLQNVGICLTIPSDHICEINTTNSLQANIRSALKKVSPDTKPEKLILLTSLEEIKINTPLATDDGVVLNYGKRQSLILPHEKNKQANIYRVLKQRAGINPDYYSNEMKFYKFKTTEININDNI